MENDLRKSLTNELQEDWEKLFKSVGVNSLEELEKAGRDTSKLVPVKKQITRGGRTVETTVYVSPKEAEKVKGKKNQPKKEKPKEKKKEESPSKKSEMKVVAPHDDGALKELHSQLDGWKNKEVSEALKEASKESYLVTAKSGGKVIGVGAFKREKDNLTMEHFGSVKAIKGIGKQLVKQLLTEASKKGLGVTIKPPKGSSSALLGMGFKDDFSGVLSLDADGVNKALGKKVSKEKEKKTE